MTLMSTPKIIESIEEWGHTSLYGMEVRITKNIPDDPKTGKPRDSVFLLGKIYIKPKAWEYVMKAINDIPEKELFKRLNNGE